MIAYFYVRYGVFDLDGTLLYTLENLYESTNFVLKKYGFPARTMEEIRSFVGNGVEKLIERALPSNTDKTTISECLTEFKTDYSKTMYEKTRPYTSVVQMLKILNSKGIKCAVVSNKYDSAVKELCGKYFKGLIQCSAGERPNLRKKPFPDSVLEVIKELKSKKCIYIGDSEVDIQTAKNAEIPCISVSWGYKDRDFLAENGAEIIVDSIEILTELLLESDKANS